MRFEIIDIGKKKGVIIPFEILNKYMIREGANKGFIEIYFSKKEVE